MKFIYGSESFLIEKEIKKLIEGLDEPIVYSNDESVDDIILDMSTSSMFFDNKTIVIKNHPIITSTKDNEEFLDSLSKTQSKMIFALETDAIKTNLPVIEFLLKNAECKEFKKIKSKDIISFIKDTVQQKGGTIDNIAAVELANRLPEDLRIIMNEVEKLLLESNNITIENIKRSIGEYLKEDYFALSNAIINLDANEIFSSYKKRRESGDEPITIISQISSVLTLALNVSIYKRQGLSISDIATKMNIHIFRIKKSNELLLGLKNTSIELLIKDLAKLDKDIKSGKVDPEHGLESYLMNLVK